MERAEKRVLNRNFEFVRTYRRGKSFLSPLAVTYVWRRKRGVLRTGITASKKIGCAVVRNRARRVMKAAAVPLLREADGPFDIVFVCRSATARAKSDDVKKVLEEHLRKAGVLGA